MKVGIQDSFDSMHSLPGHPKCGVPHGHTYRLEVVVEGPLVNGMVVDFAELKSALREVTKAFDHTDLNKLLPFPSCENIASEIHRRLKPRFQDRRVTVRIWEGDGKWAEFEA